MVIEADRSVPELRFFSTILKMDPTTTFNCSAKTFGGIPKAGTPGKTPYASPSNYPSFSVGELESLHWLYA